MTEAKKPFVVVTAGHARYLLGQAEARVAKLTTELGAAEAQVTQYKQLSETLPEGSAPAQRNTFNVGQEVRFAFGREDKRTERVGRITARKEEDGKVLQYKVQVGDGFDAQLVTVFPGSIVGLTEAAPAADEGDPLAQ